MLIKLITKIVDVLIDENNLIQLTRRRNLIANHFDETMQTALIHPQWATINFCNDVGRYLPQ